MILGQKEITDLIRACTEVKKFKVKQAKRQWDDSSIYQSVLMSGSFMFFYHDEKNLWVGQPLGFYLDMSVALVSHRTFVSILDYLKLERKYKASVEFSDDDKFFIFKDSSATLKFKKYDIDFQYILDRLSEQERNKDESASDF